MKHFEDFNLKNTTLDFINKNRFVDPTPIQEEVIPPVLKGKDIIGQSQTGSGKTHAFLIPIFQGLDEELQQVQAVKVILVEIILAQWHLQMML